MGLASSSVKFIDPDLSLKFLISRKQDLITFLYGFEEELSTFVLFTYKRDMFVQYLLICTTKELRTEIPIEINRTCYPSNPPLTASQ